MLSDDMSTVKVEYWKENIPGELSASFDIVTKCATPAVQMVLRHCAMRRTDTVTGEIGEKMNVSDGKVRMWMTLAKLFLKTQPEIMSYGNLTKGIRRLPDFYVCAFRQDFLASKPNNRLFDGWLCFFTVCFFPVIRFYYTVHRVLRRIRRLNRTLIFAFHPFCRRKLHNTFEYG